MDKPEVEKDVPNINENYAEVLEWTEEEEEAFLAILSKASNEEEDL